MAIISRSFSPPATSFFLFGPRGTGKSTLLEETLPGAVAINLLRPDVYRAYLAYPERLSQVVSPLSDTTIIIDEVQRVPELLSVVHYWIEQKRGLRFVLTGSSSRKLKQTGVDLLAGRAIRKELHPFMAHELGSLFDLDSALAQGLLPIVWNSPSPEAVLSTYLSVYMEDEVKAEGFVRSLGAFSRFLEVMSFSHAQQINYSEIAREVQVSRNAVTSYSEILEDLLLAFSLPVFAKRPKRKTVTQQKFYYFDTGVYQSIRPKGRLDNPGVIEGAALEGLVAQHLRAWISYRSKGDTLFYWRTRAGTEVDFILYGPELFWAIEVKSSAKIRSSDLQALKAFYDEYPEAQCLLLYRGDEVRIIDNVLCVPCQQFLLGLDPKSPFPVSFKAI